MIANTQKQNIKQLSNKKKPDNPAFLLYKIINYAAGVTLTVLAVS